MDNFALGVFKGQIGLVAMWQQMFKIRFVIISAR